MTVKEISKELQSISAEVAVLRRQREDMANKAVQALSDVSPADVQMLSTVVPLLAEIVTYTVEDIKNNQHDEVVKIKSVMSDLQTYIESRLSYYEEQL